MKKIFIILTLIILLTPAVALGQTAEEEIVNEAEGAVEETVDSAQDKVDQIKDRVTSQVEKLNLVEKRGIVGTVESITDNQIRLNDINDKIRLIEVDELTKYSSGQISNFDASDLEQGLQISAIGLYNKDSEKLLARFINDISIPTFLNGVITNIDDENFTIQLTTENEQKYTIDIETVTRTYSFTDEDMNQGGFSELENLQNAVVTGFLDQDEEDRLSATRIIFFPDIPANPRVNAEIAEVDEENSPTPEENE